MKIQNQYKKDGNKQNALAATRKADDEFIKEAVRSNVQPLGAISAGLIKAKEIGEKTGIINTKTFSGLGNKISFTTKDGKLVNFTKKTDPTARLKAIAGAGSKTKKQSGGLGPLAIGVISALAGTALDKLFGLIKDKMSGSGYMIDPTKYTDAQKRSMIRRVLY